MLVRTTEGETVLTEQRTVVERSFRGTVSNDEVTAFLDHALAFKSALTPHEIAVGYDIYQRWHPRNYRNVPVIFDPNLCPNEVIRIVFLDD